jgi:hypothetical protein
MNKARSGVAWFRGSLYRSADGELASQSKRGRPRAYGWSRDGKMFAFTRGNEIRDIVLISESK